MKKRLMCMILSILMLVSLLPMGVAAEEGDTPTEETNTSATESTTPEETEATISDDAAAVQALIDALPTADEVAAMDTDGQNEVYTQASDIWDAYYSLTDEEQSQVDISSLEALADYFNGEISTLADSEQTDSSVMSVEIDGTVTYYDSVKDALAAVTAGTTGTATLLCNATLTGTKVLKGNLTIDLGGYTLNTGSYTLSIGSDANVVIENGSITGSAAGSQSGIIKMTSSSASLEMNGVTVTNTTTSTSTSNVIYLDPKVNITFKATNCSLSISSSQGRVIAGGSGTTGVSSTIELSGCNLSSAYRTFVMTGTYASISIDGCTITTTSTDSTDAAIYLSTSKTSEITINNTILIATNCNAIGSNNGASSTGTVTITGSGTSVTGKVTVTKPSIEISGGTFDTDVSDYVVASYEAVRDEETGTYTVAEAKESFTLGIYGDDTTSIPAEIASGEGAATMYVKVSADYIGTDGYYSTTAYPTTSLTYTPAEGSKDSGNYIFAGWYTASTEGDVTTYTACGSDMWNDSTATEYYAKFVDANVLTVKVQAPSGLSANSTSADLRFVSTVDCLDYQTVGFEFVINSTTTKTSTTTVYQNLTATDNEGVEAYSYTPSQVCSSASTYFFAFTITNIKNNGSNFATKIYVTPYWITLDGTTVYGTQRNDITVAGMYSTSASE